MTDEELGRAYAAAKGITPTRFGVLFKWTGYQFPIGLGTFLFGELDYNEAAEGGRNFSGSERDAFVWLGSNLKEYLSGADEVRATLAGQDMGSAGARQDFKEWVAATIDAAYHLNDWPAKDEDGRNEAFGLVADTIVDMAYSHFRMDGES